MDGISSESIYKGIRQGGTALGNGAYRGVPVACTDGSLQKATQSAASGRYLSVGVRGWE